MHTHHPKVGVGAQFEQRTHSDQSAYGWLRYCWFRLLLGLGFSAITGCTTLSASHPEPVIQSVDGPLTPGQLVSVRGLNFSDAKKHGIVIQDSGGKVTLVKDGEAMEIESDYLWTKMGSPWASPLKLESDQGNDWYYQGKGKSYNGYLAPLEDAGARRLFVAWQFKPTQNPGEAKGSNKLIRIWDNTNGKGTRISWTQMHMTYNGGGPSWGDWPGDVGKWNQMSLWVDSNTGEIDALTNGQQVHSIDDFQKADTEKGLNIKLLGFDPNYGERYEDMTFAIDELYVASTRARVVISDRATWKDAQARQNIQLPVKWSDSHITFIFNPLSRLSGEKYLYVVNEQGVAISDGHPVSIKR